MKRWFLTYVCFWVLSLTAQNDYFPPVNGEWKTTNPEDLGWCTDKIDPLYHYLDSTNSKGFMVLKGGRIVLEKYFAPFTKDSVWYWASAGKSLTAFAIGIAQKQGLLSITDPVSKYLGQGWTSCTPEQENKITIQHVLEMSTGIDDHPSDQFCNDPECFTYKAEPGTRWSYNTGVYSILVKLIEKITGQDYTFFLAKNIGNATGMKGLWVSGQGELYITKLQTMARFGLLIANHGVWAGNDILKDSDYFQAMVNTSQPMNLAYGFLWWLNGKKNFMVPGVQFTIPGWLVPNAPEDSFFALGKYGQIICIIPSLDIVIVRLGEEPGNNENLVSPVYLNTIFTYLNQVMCNTNASKSLDNLQPVKIFPNPANQTLYWSAIDNSSIKEVEIVNTLGQSVRKLRVSGTEIQLSYLIPGNYTILFKDSNQRVIARERFTKI